jgi:membrane protease YdiL (CAAX protease family)
MNGADRGLELTPAVAVFTALAAGFGQLLVAWSLAASVGPTLSVLALGGLIAYGAFFALLAPRLGPAPGVRLGFVRPARGSALAAVLLLGSVLLVSEIDNVVRALFPLPAALREALEAEQAAPAGTAALREGFELVLVKVAVFPVIYELFYRGLVQPALVERLGPVRGVLLTAAVEASAALSYVSLFLWAWPVEAARAAVLGTLRQCSGSLLPSLALHALMGAVEVGAFFELFGIPGFDRTGISHTPPAWLLGAAASTGAGLWVCRRLVRRAPADA